MDNNMSRVVIVVLGVALIIAAIFAFNQTNTLNETATELADVEGAGTQLAEEAAGTATQASVNLGDANDSGTQSAENAAATATQNAVEIADANASATQSSDDAAATGTQGSVNLDSANATATQSADNADATQRSLQVTGTRAAVQAVSDLYVAGSTATQAAENLATVQAEATENTEMIADLESDATTAAENLANVESDATSVAANLADVEDEATRVADDLATMEVEATTFADNADATATQQAEEIADTVATVAAITDDLNSSEEMVSTLEADLDEANETIDAQATTIAGFDKDEDDNTSSSSEGGFVLFEAEDFSMLMPEDFLVFDLRTDQDEAIEAFDDLGSPYDWLADNAREGEDSFTVIGARDTPTGLFSIDAFLMDIDEAIQGFTAQSYVNILVGFFEDQDYDIIEEGIIEQDGPDPGYVIVDTGNGLVNLVYVYVVDGTAYLMFFETTEDNFDDVREEFDTSAQSFQVID